MREKYETLSLAVLRDIAKNRGMQHISALRKGELIDALVALDDKENAEKSNARQVQPVSEAMAPEQQVSTDNGSRSAARQTASERGESTAAVQNDRGTYRRLDRNAQRVVRTPDRQERYQERSQERSPERSPERLQERSPERSLEKSQDRYQDRSGMRRRVNTRPMQEGVSANNTAQSNAGQNNQSASAVSAAPASAAPAETQPERERVPMDLASLDSGNEATGILEVMAEGYGFIRSSNYLPGENDVYVAPSQIRRFGLKTGDVISGNTRVRAQQEKFSALLYLKTINGFTPAEAAKRYNFEDMTPIFPNARLRMERSQKETAMRVVDLLSPIGKGQRGMIVSPPKAGKTTLLKDIARSILKNEPDMHLIILLIDERPEEVTDIKEAIVGDNVEVIYSTFDELPEHHKRVSEMGIERAKRLVEHQENVTILLDSITRLARAYNLTVPPSGRTLSGGLDPAALHMPKRFFGAARNMREGGSLTILATALVDTGSKMDDVVYEEFKGTGNMELVLDRKLSERRIFPAIDIQKSGTRREDLLLTPEEQEACYIMRKALNGMKSDEAVENILNTFIHTKDNAELVARIRRQRYV